MRLAHLPAAVLVAALLGGACSGDDDDRGLDALETPTFAPADGSDDGGSGDEDGDDGAATTADDGGGTTTTTVPVTASGPDVTTTPGDDTTTTTRAPQERVSVDDPDDDAVGGLDDDPPPWTDLAAMTMIRQGNAYGLRVQLAGGDAPETSDGESTMNIASFYDVDGDGDVDYEVWANLGPNGWGGSWFDDEGHGAFGEDSNVSIEVDGDEVVILFPDVMLDQPDRFRFSVASEYGTMDVIGSTFARRDDVPDDDQVVSFPD